MTKPFFRVQTPEQLHEALFEVLRLDGCHLLCAYHLCRTPLRKGLGQWKGVLLAEGAQETPVVLFRLDANGILHAVQQRAFPTSRHRVRRWGVVVVWVHSLHLPRRRCRRWGAVVAL